MYELIGEGVAQSLFRFEYNDTDEVAHVFIKDSTSLRLALDDTYRVSSCLANIWFK